MPPFQSDDALAGLRAALAVSPDNVPLRLHLGRALLDAGLADEAEEVLKLALALDSANPQLRHALARSYQQQGKRSQALVILEDLAKDPDVDPAALVLFARLLLATGEAMLAGRQYRRAIALDPGAADEALEEVLDADREPERVPVKATEPEQPAGPLIPLERPEVGFEGIGGLAEVKQQIRVKVLHPLQHPELYQAYGKKAGGGVLMYGPPGCGKTHLARATAGEGKTAFLAVGIQDVLSMWLGGSEKNLHAIFEQARAMAPCVLFFDEIDALGANRTDHRHASGRALINQFLQELDGVQASNEGVLVLGATNAPWHVDAAFRRPGRFDRVLFVPPPDREARSAILRIQLKGRPVADVDADLIAKKTVGFSGADLASVVDRAIEDKLEEAMKLGRPVPIGTNDLLAAVKSMNATTREWFASAQNYATFANQGGQYDDVLKYMDRKPD